jgi:hypothetical protein
MRGREASKVFFRFAAIVFCVCVTAAFALSVVLVLAYAHHEHNHDGAGGRCLVCEQIAAAQNCLWWLDSLARCAIFSCCASLILLCKPEAAFARAYPKTLTALKIKLNN